MEHTIDRESRTPTTEDAGSKAATAASKLLANAEKQLNPTKTAYENAKLAYNNAKQICSFLDGTALSVPLTSGAARALCEDCARIPLASLFNQRPNSKTPRRRVGDLFTAVERQSWCSFCKFLIEAFQVGAEDDAERLEAHLKPRDSAVYFALVPDGLPGTTEQACTSTALHAPSIGSRLVRPHRLVFRTSV